MGSKNRPPYLCSSSYNLLERRMNDTKTELAVFRPCTNCPECQIFQVFETTFLIIKRETVSNLEVKNIMNPRTSDTGGMTVLYAFVGMDVINDSVLDLVSNPTVT